MYGTAQAWFINRLDNILGGSCDLCEKFKTFYEKHDIKCVCMLCVDWHENLMSCLRVCPYSFSWKCGTMKFDVKI